MSIITIDFETYSEAGHFLENNRWATISASPPHGLAAVGAAAYAEHSSTKILSLSYDKNLWLPGMPPPVDLFEHIAAGGLISAWNSQFEFYIWQCVCYRRMGWVQLPWWQLRDPMAAARAFCLPGALANAARVLGVSEQKNTDGKRLLAKFSKPPGSTDTADLMRLYEYNLQDVRAEAAVAAAIPQLTGDELQVWLVDQLINYRGIYIDSETLQNFIKIIETATLKYTEELRKITGGAINSASEVLKIRNWLATQGVNLHSLTADAVSTALQGELPADARRVLEIRASLSASSVKKLYSIDRRLTSDGRLHGLLAYCGAERTGRFAGRGPQPQNLPNSGPDIKICECGRAYARGLNNCPWCEADEAFSDVSAWDLQAANDCAKAAKVGLARVEQVFTDAFGAISGSLRGLFCAAPGADLICSDYSAIEAVILAELAGETWRQEVFRTHGKIYEMSASKITGIPFDEITPSIRKIGKIAELASGYQGGVGAWRRFGADEYVGSDSDIAAAIKRWRAESPAIVRFWYGIEDAAKNAIAAPGAAFSYRDIIFQTDKNRAHLFCRLPSGRYLTYHEPALAQDTRGAKITYKGWATIGGWITQDTYGGKLTENIVQATARDILCHALVELERAGYPVVLHVHDEIIAEVAENTGAIEEFEKIMSQMPPWAAGWPIFARGGWREKKYRK